MVGIMLKFDLKNYIQGSNVKLKFFELIDSLISLFIIRIWNDYLIYYL